ncbi:MAG: ATP synthase F1 subunit delta [Elusimicrobiota bacterium]|jgi:F-type H+-transporting ATPase subunit delta
MQESVVARKYARALFAEAKSHNQILLCQEGLEEFIRVLRLRVSLRDVLTHPFIASDGKKRLIHSVLGKWATPLLERFFYLLVSKHRFDALLAIVQEYQEEVDRYQEVQPLRVRVAFPMAEAQQQVLQANLEKWLGQKVRLDVQVDSSLIGGLVVQTQDRVLDQSLKGQLKRLRDQLIR